MASEAIQTNSDTIAETLATLVATGGSRSHRWCGAPDLVSGRSATRDLADLVHALCMLHGRHPGVMDHAAAHAALPAADDWLKRAVSGFAMERAYLARIAVAAGPLPSTPGQADAEAALHAQSHALDMLAQSDRTGCALGAAIALALDWIAIRAVLDAAARRLDVAIAPYALPGEVETSALAHAIDDGHVIARAIGFGARQVLAQHRGLWTLLETRHGARE